MKVKKAVSGGGPALGAGHAGRSSLRGSRQPRTPVSCAAQLTTCAGVVLLGAPGKLQARKISSPKFSNNVMHCTVTVTVTVTVCNAWGTHAPSTKPERTVSASPRP